MKEVKEKKKREKKKIEVIDEGIGIRIDTKIKAGQDNARQCCNSPVTAV